MKILATAILTLTFFSTIAEAKRYIIPKDQNVVTNINTQSPMISELNQSFSVLVWNIYKGKIVGWEADHDKLSSQADILLFQEAYLNPRMKRVFGNSNDFNFVMATAWEDAKYSNTKSGVVTGSRVFPVKINWQRSYFREPGLKTPKMNLFTEYPIAGSDKTLLVGNIHGINFVKSWKLKHMIDQAANVIEQHQGPVLFAGDFNTWTRTKMTMMNKTLKKIGLNSIKFSPDNRKKFLGRPLDHIWIKDLEVLDSKILSNITTSDHKPMTISVRVVNK